MSKFTRIQIHLYENIKFAYYILDIQICVNNVSYTLFKFSMKW